MQGNPHERRGAARERHRTGPRQMRRNRRQVCQGFRDESVPIEERLAQNPIEHTIVAEGEPEDYPEGTYAYNMVRFGKPGSTILPGAKISRELAFRLDPNMRLSADASLRHTFFA